MNNDKLVTGVSSCDSYQSRISWSAIISGALVGVGLSFLLQLFGVAISLSAYHSTSAGASTMAMGGFLALLIATIVSMGVAGYVAGLLGRSHYSHCHGGVIYGFLTWSLALLLTALLVIPLTNYMTSYNKTLAPKVVVSDTMQKNVDVTTDNNSSKPNQNTGDQAVVKVSPEALTGSSWVIFLLFFLGAISSCIGACYGMNNKHKELENGRSDTYPRDRNIP
ncbi:MAG: hypothetical protein H0T84_11620 [Tatlockia sp.]|nr:hypothetical protein [Tatlockia sp.]